MKGCKKVMAVVIVLSMLMSVIIPVNAASVNLAGEIIGITDNVISHTADVKASDEAAAPYWSLSNATAVYSDGAVIVHRTAANGQNGLVLYNAPLQSGKKYYIEGYFRGENIDTVPSNAQIRFYLANPGGASNKASITNTGISKYSGDGTIVTEYVYPDSANLEKYVKSSGYFTVGTNESGTAELGLTLGIKVGSVGNSLNYDYSVKDIKLYEVKAFSGTATANGTSEAVFTFSNEIKAADSNSFIVTSTDAEAATPTVSVETDGNVCTVSLSDYSYSTTYTITADGIKDIFGQTLTEPVSVSVTTEEDTTEPDIPEPDVSDPADRNIAGTITGITDNVISFTGARAASSDASAPKWVVTSGATVVYEDGIVKVTGRKSGDAASGIALANLGVLSGKTYYVTGEIKADSLPSSGVRDARFSLNTPDGANNKAVAPTVVYGNQNETGTVTKYVALTDTNTWHKMEGVFTVGADSGTKELGLNLELKVGQNANSQDLLYSVRNIRVEELLPDFFITSDLENNSSDLNTEFDVGIEFSNAPLSFTSSNTELTTGGQTVSDAVSVTSVNANKYTLSLAGLERGKRYVLTIKGVKDSFGQTIDDFTLAFSTTVSPNLVEMNGHDWSFENGRTFGYIEGTGAMSIVNGADERIVAPHGSKMLKITGRSAGSLFRLNSVGMGGTAYVEAGKTYKLTMSVRTVADELGNLTTDRASAVIYQAFPSTNTVTVSNVKVSASDISSGGWTTVTGFVDIVANSPTSAPAYGGIHIGCKITGTTSVYIDNVVLKEYIPEFTIETNPQDGAVVSSDVITIAFSDVPVSFTESNVAVSGGTAYIAGVNKVSDTVYTVSLGNLDYGAQYSLEIINVNDSFGQTADKTIGFTTGTSNTANDKNILKDKGYNFSFETGTTFAIKYEGSSKTISMVKGDNEGVPAYHGTRMLKVVNPSPSESVAYAHRVNGIMGGEIGKKYVISCYARTVKPGETVTASISGTSAYPTSNTVSVANVSIGSVQLTNEWQRLTSVVKIVENASGTKEADKGFHILFNANKTDIYVDNYQLLEVPEEELHIASSTPADGSDGVSVTSGKVVLNFSANLSEGFNPYGKIKFYKGDTDVTEALVTETEVGFGNGSIEVGIGELENNTVYTMEANNITDYLGRTATGRITFTTAKVISTSGFASVNAQGEAVDFETASASDVAGVTAGVSNTSNSDIKNPVFIYTVYNPETNEMEQIGATSFEGTWIPGQTEVLRHSVAGLENKRLGLYLINSSVNTAFAAEPFVKDFSGTDSDFERGQLISDSFMYDIDIDAGEITLAGRANKNSYVPVILLGSENGTAPAVDFYTNIKGAVSGIVSGNASITEAELDSYAVHFAAAKSDENGYWSIVLPIDADYVQDKFYYAITSGGSFANDFTASKIFVPSKATEQAAEAAINGAADVEALISAIEEHDFVFGLNTASSVYASYTNEVAQAILAMNGGNAYPADKFSGTGNTLKSHFNTALEYYTRQAEAVSKINLANSDELTEILKQYSQGINVLGGYGQPKLDFNSVYNTYGYLNINRRIIGITCKNMNEFITAFNSAAAALAQEQNNPAPGTSSNPSKPSGPSGGGGGGGGAMYVPTTAVPQSSVPGAYGFTDIGEAKWAEDSILNLVELGIINGMGDGSFNPGGNVTREQFVKMLLIMLNVEISETESSFKDVDTSAWYAPYVATAYKLGIVNGISETEFGIGSYITRQDLAVMALRACKAGKVELPKKQFIEFSDKGQIVAYAQDAVKALAMAGVINGMSDGAFMPLENTTRAQAAVILDRLYNL